MKEQIRASTRFLGIQKILKDSSCKHVDDRSHPIFYR